MLRLPALRHEEFRLTSISHLIHASLRQPDYSNPTRCTQSRTLNGWMKTSSRNPSLRPPGCWPHGWPMQRVCFTCSRRRGGRLTHANGHYTICIHIVFFDQARHCALFCQTVVRPMRLIAAVRFQAWPPLQKPLKRLKGNGSFTKKYPYRCRCRCWCDRRGRRSLPAQRWPA